MVEHDGMVAGEGGSTFMRALSRPRQNWDINKI